MFTVQGVQRASAFAPTSNIAGFQATAFHQYSVPVDAVPAQLLPHHDALSLAAAIGSNKLTPAPSPLLYSYSASGSQPPSASISPSELQSAAATPFSPSYCSICNDRATGKHYGASSCDGCKGFFRRTVRKHQRYECRFNRNCLIDRDRRNACRYCRYKKCIFAGMRKEAVQNERDRIHSRKHNKAQASVHEKQVNEILKAEEVYSQLRSTVITVNANGSAESKVSAAQPSGFRLATIDDISDSMNKQLLLLVQWVKLIPDFYTLPLDDQVALLRSYAAEHLLLGVARRSLELTDILLLSNEAFILQPNSCELPDINIIIDRVLEELVAPMRQLELDDVEYSLLKAIVFFNPFATGLVNREKIKEKRSAILLALLDHVTNKPLQSEGRFGFLLLLLPSLHSIGQQMKEGLQLANLFGLAKTDKLLIELLGISETTGYASSDEMQTSEAAQSEIFQCAKVSTESTGSSGASPARPDVKDFTPADRANTPPPMQRFYSEKKETHP